MKEHLERHMAEKKFSCDKCGRRFTCREYLDVHYRKHTGSLPFECSVCGKRFHRQGSFRMHGFVHSTARPFSCPYCGLRFKTGSNLKQHVAIHTGGRRFTCKHCAIEITGRTGYVRHLMDEHGEGSWLECGVCQQKFLLRGNLNAHMLKHSAEKRYVCDRCLERFMTVTQLKIHQFKKHDGDGRYSCGFCLRVFYYKCGVMKHLPHCKSLK